MNPNTLIPSPDAIPVAWPWFKALLIPCFTIHLLFMNALLGTSIIGWIGSLRSRPQDFEPAMAISRRLPFFMAFAINFGVAALLFMQVLYGHLFYTSSILMAVWWMAGLALVLIAYVAAYWLDFRFDALGTMRKAVFTLMVLCLLMVAFIFVNNLTLMVDPASWPRYFDQPGGTLWHWDDPTLIPRYLHFVTAAIAVGGLLLAVFNEARSPERAGRYMQWFTAATAAQFIIGGWFFLALPRSIRLDLMGGDQWMSIIMAASMLGVLLSLFFGVKQMIRPAAWAAAFTVLGMVLVRDAVRSAYLEPYFKVEQLTAGKEFSPVMVFGVFVVVGVTAVVYMLRLWKGAAPK